MESQLSFSFAGCGFLGIYHVGVAACLKKYAPNLLVSKIAGASAGALAAVFLLCDAPLGIITSSVLKTATEARKRLLGPFSPTFNVEKLLREGLLGVLPPDAHERVNGKIFISVTRVCDGKNVLLSHFDTSEDLIQALICSTFIPAFSGWKPLTIKGVRYIDGGFSDNIPQLDSNTITVSPFCGEADICPKDANAGILTISLANTSIELSRENLYRFSMILFPPPPAILNRMCQQGFNDALDFLQRNYLINCTRCLAVHSTFNLEEKKEFKYDVALDIEGTCDNCPDCQLQRQEAILDSLPEAVGSILQDAIDSANKGLMTWVFKHKSMKLSSILSLPYILPIEIAYAAFIKFVYSAPSIKDLTTLASQIIQLILVLIRSWIKKPASVAHRHHSGHRADSNFSCQFAITEFTGKEDDISQALNGRQKINFTVDTDETDMPAKTHTDAMSLESEALSQLALRCAAKSLSRQTSVVASRTPSRVTSMNPSRAVSRAVSRIPSLENFSASSGPELDDLSHHMADDTFEKILHITSHQEAVMAYYYMDDNNEMRVTEIFDMSEGMMGERDGEGLSEEVFHTHFKSLKDDSSSKSPKPSGSFSSVDGSMSEPEADQGY